ncbi:MAG TPA: hypothetical protein VFH51_20510 [Myxococcota bacterium]|nr:hypothetical protein [Myxococcota bacterium]
MKTSYLVGAALCAAVTTTCGIAANTTDDGPSSSNLRLANPESENTETPANPACKHFFADCETPRYYGAVNKDPNGPTPEEQAFQGCAALKQEAKDCVALLVGDGAPSESTVSAALEDGSCGCTLAPNKPQSSSSSVQIITINGSTTVTTTTGSTTGK